MIYIYAPYKIVSGGPELLHQLCDQLNKFGQKAKMVYYDFWKIKKPTKNVIDAYEMYSTEYTIKTDDSYNNTFIVPETGVYLLRRIKKAKKIIWWLSVDFYYLNRKTLKYKIETLFGLMDYSFRKNNLIHLCQSYYSKEFLKANNIVEDNIFNLSDYLNDKYIFESQNEKNVNKEDIVLYNPKKGTEYTNRLINHASDIKWVAIQNMTKEQMVELLQKSKLYIDFGEHPGKDRLPREAAISGCCIITGRRGAAGNPFDLCINDDYKIDEKEHGLEDIVIKIKEVLKNYDILRKDFEEYRNTIKNEKKKFIDDVLRLIEIGVL